ncbi:class F sortase [Streptacidiphilus carbonis]|uniref:class F sortase n=1 Tax=Streptacidiphilus carbonis TaxID=105422 RepID=UPI000B08BD99|nr:class F sortase [Streptacidiphilus carbonis]
MERPDTRRSPRLRNRVSAVAAIAALCAGGLLISKGLSQPGPPPQPTAAQGFTATDAAPSYPSSVARVPSRAPAPPAPMSPAVPVRVRIPAIAVSAPITALALLPSGHLAAPTDSNRNLAGWYAAGTAPGAVGTAIVAGHVDTQAGPAVFYNLGALRKGTAVDVDRADHTTAVFTVDAVEAYAASDFPSNKVYGNVNRPELRLITCGAGFSKSRQEYLGNVVVFAHLTSKAHTRH